jgi:hypothetical protein
MFYWWVPTRISIYMSYHGCWSHLKILISTCHLWYVPSLSWTGLLSLAINNYHILITTENVGIAAYHWQLSSWPGLVRLTKENMFPTSRVLSTYQAMITGISSLHIDYIIWYGCPTNLISFYQFITFRNHWYAIFYFSDRWKRIRDGIEAY